MKISGTSTLPDSSNGQTITMVAVTQNGSSVYAAYVTSGNTLTTCQSFNGEPLMTSVTIVS